MSRGLTLRPEAENDIAAAAQWYEEQRSGLSLEFEYDRARLRSDAVERWAGYFCTLLAAAVDHPDTPVRSLPLLSQAEQRQLLVEWNQTVAPYPQDRCLHELFEAQAARTPERPAVRFDANELSYCKLNEQANQLAHYLRGLGVGPDSLVGLCLLCGLVTRVAAVVSAVLQLAFIIGISSAWARGLQIDCGCFGGGGGPTANATAASATWPLICLMRVKGFLARVA